MPALFAVESGASVKQVQPPVIQGKRQDDTFLSVNIWRKTVRHYLKMIAQTRDDVLEQLAEHAQSLGANAVLGMHFDSGEFDAGQGQAMNEVTAYGTVVVVEPV